MVQRFKIGGSGEDKLILREDEVIGVIRDQEIEVEEGELSMDEVAAVAAKAIKEGA